MDLVILVVIYNLQPEQSATLQSLSRCKEFLAQHSHRIIVRDNSAEASPTIQPQLDQLLAPLHFDYWQDGQNLSLSEIYNKVIHEELSEQQTLVIWDHDSQFDTNYFQQLQTAQQQHPDCALFLPIIYNHGHLVSPSNMVGFKGSYWKQPRYGRVSSRCHTAINSGMAIRAYYLLHRFPGYDPQLKFYNTDNYFMWRYAQTEPAFVVLNVSLQHELNFYAPHESFAQQAARYKEMRRSAIYLAGLKHGWLKPLTTLYFFIFSIKLALQRRNWRYIFLS